MHCFPVAAKTPLRVARCGEISIKSWEFSTSMAQSGKIIGTPLYTKRLIS
jgi:hypothetical protein